MPERSRPKKGSLAYWPRKRARRQYPSISNWPKAEKGLKGFAGYKVGMTHLMAIDDKPGSPTKGEEIQVPVTILEVPPLKVVAIRFYKEKEGELKVFKEIWARGLEKRISKRAPNNKEKLKKPEDFKEVDEIRAIVSDQPWKVRSIPRKKPNFFEISIGGDLEEKFEYAKEKLGKEVEIGEVFKEGEQIDVIGVTKGKGFTGSVKRFGVKRLQHKAEKLRRKAGSLGAWHPKKTTFATPQFGQMGYHTRTELNKRIYKIGKKPEEINKKGGYKNYGLLSEDSDYLLLKGSAPGPKKRFLLLRKAVRPKEAIPKRSPKITFIKK